MELRLSLVTTLLASFFALLLLRVFSWSLIQNCSRMEWEENSSWWRRMVQPPANESSHVNRTGDVFCANCVSHPDEIACIRSGILAIFGIITACVAFARIVRLHATQPSIIQLFLYYLLCVHCISGSFEWLLGWNTQLALLIAYAKAVELLVICYFYLDVASTMMHWSSTAGRRLCFSALFLMFTYFTLFLVMGLLLSEEPWADCHAPYWIWFSAGEFLIVQLTVGSFFLILKRMSRISASPTIQRKQKIDLISLFWTFETSAMADLCYHFSLFLLADDHKGCSGVFNHNQALYSTLKAPYDFFSFLLPVWAILYVFRPVTRKCNEAMTEVSSRGPSIAEVVVVRNWRRRYRPLTQPSVYERPVFSVGRRRPGQESPRLRHVNSAPLLLNNRRLSISRSLVSSPLYSIPEGLENGVVDYDECTYEDEILVGSVDRFSTVPMVDE